MLPTDRRGRYLVYRTRAEARLFRAWKNRPRGGFDGQGRLRRGHDTRDLFSQAFYPGTPKKPWRPGYWEATPDDDPLKGRYQKPGIVADAVHPFPWWGPNTHVRFSVTTYYLRPMRRVPKLRNLPLRETLTLPDSTWYRHYYPYYRYPSGALNPNWWKGVDDDGNPPPPH